MPARCDDSLLFLPASPRGSCSSQQCWDPPGPPHMAGDEWGTGESLRLPWLSPLGRVHGKEFWQRMSN